MLSDLFVRVLNISMVSCYTIVVVMVFRALILRWERKYAYLLWFVVFVNLCIPFRITGPFSLVPAWIADFDITEQGGERMQEGYEGKTDYLPNEEIITTVTVHHYDTPVGGENGVPGTDSNSETTYVQGVSEKSVNYLPNEKIIVTEGMDTHHYYAPEEGKNGVAGTDTNDETTYYSNDSKNNGLRRMRLTIVWGIGVILLVAWNIRAALRLRSKLKSAEPFLGNESSVEGGGQNIKLADGIETPFLWGLFNPAIYLPRMMDEEEYTYVIAHESYHRKRKDYILKPLFFTITVIHWFNPLVWASYLLLVRDMEISCDDAVIANADKDIRKKYAESLLKYAARQNGYTLTPITFGEPSLKCRIKNVLHYKERNMVLSAVILCVVVTIMAGLIVKPRQTKKEVLPDYQEAPLIMEETPIKNMPIVDKADDKAETAAFYTGDGQEIIWKAGMMLEGTGGENMYTKILLESDVISGEVSDFRTFIYDEESADENVLLAYVMAGKIQDGAITGSLWLVGSEAGEVQPVLQNVTLNDTRIESIVFNGVTYVIINYMTDNHTDGRILPISKNDLSIELMAGISGEKRVGDVAGTIVCGENVYAFDSNMVWKPEEQRVLEDKFGVAVSLPENANWIVNSEYYLEDENLLRITYYDAIADADCTLLAAKNEDLPLPEHTYDETLNESWEGRTLSNQNIIVKVQHEAGEGRTVLVTWEYNEYKFAIIGEAKEIHESVPKVALNIIHNMD